MKGISYFMSKKLSNFELMRIVSMFFIVIGHIIVHGHVFSNCTDPSIKLFFRFILFLVIVHVNSFVLLTGYFQSKKSFKQSSLWKIINANWFYRVLIMISLLLFGVITVDKVTFIKEILPININEYWFIQNYILLYCLSPFLNKAIRSFDKVTFQRLLFVLFIIFSILPIMTGNGFINNTGYTLYTFICLYMTGAYLREYPLQNSYLFQKMSRNMFQLFMIMIFVFFLFVNMTTTSFFQSILHYNPVTKEFAGYFVKAKIMYHNPFIIVQSIAYFGFFTALVIKQNKFINKIATAVFGVYLIHENNFIRDILYKTLLIDNGHISSYKFILYFFVVAILIYVVCTIIELLRQLLFKFIYDLKLSKKIRDKYYSFIKNFYFTKKPL